MTRDPRRFSARWFGLAFALAFAASPLGITNLGLGAAAQQKSGARDTAKESEKLQKQADEVKGDLKKTGDDLGSAMELYNSIIGGKETNPRKAHKKLVGLLDGVLKKREKNAGKWDKLKDMSNEFFEGWESEIADYSDETMKAVGQQRLDVSKGHFAKLSEALSGARETYGRFLASFKDQVTFMGRDLSPAALAQLQEPASRLNEQYSSLQAAVGEMRAAMDENRVALTGQVSK